MEGKSLDITEEKRNRLKEVLPEAFMEGKIDWEKLKATLGDDIEFKNERYVLNWAGKSEAFRALQAPTAATLVPCKEESVEFGDTENIFIEGENLEVLKVLQKAYFGKIKMIYIDPPYNTGTDKFIYPDKFSETKVEYLSRVGARDENGYMTQEGLFRKNSSDNGHYHSNWLSMMYPRIFLARNLLREDGVIFISIDENEGHNLKLLMNEIFGEENLICDITWQKRKGGGNDSFFVAVDHEIILVYARNKSIQTNKWRVPYDREYLKRYKESDVIGNYYWDTLSRHGLKNPIIYDVVCPDGTIIKNGEWQTSEDVFKAKLENGEIRILKNKKGDWTVHHKVRQPEGKVFRSIINNVTNADAANDIEELFGESKLFSNPKPVGLIINLLNMQDKDSLILDFFSGSATTAQAVLDLNIDDDGNRRFICVQMPEKCEDKSEAFKAGYTTIAEIGKERIRRVIKKIKTEQQGKLDVDDNAAKPDLGFKVFKLQRSNFKIWRSDVKTEEELVAQLTLHIDPVDEDATIENILYELLLKSGVPLTARIEEKGGYYLVNGGEIALILKKIDESIVKAAISEKPQKIITLDRLFENNDQLKTNTALQLKDAEIDFRVV